MTIRSNRWLSIGLALAAAGAPQLAAAQPGQGADRYFLSKANPLATADQRDLEAMALRVVATPEVQKAKEIARARWKTLVGPRAGAEAWARFDRFLDEYVFHYTLKALNSDPGRPRIVHYNMLPHRWFGVDVPGSRQGGGDNPDNVYALIPIEYGARYELSVRRSTPAPADETYTLMGNLTPTMTLASIEGRDVVAAPDGSFTITLDPDPKGARPNHIRTDPDARYLFIRQSRADWRQRPAEMRIRRLDPPRLPPLTEAQLVQRAARYVIDDIPAMYWWIAVMADLPRNEMTQPKPIAGLGGLVSQHISFGHLELADDEALVITSGPGGAAYRNIVLHDTWFDALDYAERTSSMTNAQGIPNADGTTTYVVSIRDPGVHNWLDPQGLHELLVVHRWQALPREAGTTPPPSMTTKRVKLRDLAAALPPGTRMVTPAERAAQQRERAAMHALRFAE